MAEDQGDRNRDDLSDEPSQHRLEEYRQKGKVAQSRELSGTVALLAVGVTLYVISNISGHQVTSYMRKIFEIGTLAKIDLSQPGVLYETLMEAVTVIAMIAAPAALAAMLLGGMGSFLQIGPVFSGEPLKPEFSRIDPAKGFKRLFSMKQLYDGLRLLLRASVVVGLSYILVKSEVLDSAKFLLGDPGSIPDAFFETGKIVFISLIIVLFFFAGFDLWLQRWEYGKSVRLTKQEAKEEFKEREGDPLIKARIRSVQREMARRRMMNEVKNADVVITNPTHIAVAIKYERDQMEAPKVIAKGADFLAKKIKKIAAESGVPTVENVPLARALYKTVKIGQVIPRVLYKAVAEVLAYVFKLNRRKLGDE